MVERGGGDDGSGGVVVVRGMVMVVELWWAAVGRQPEERAARGGEIKAGVSIRKLKNASLAKKTKFPLYAGKGKRVDRGLYWTRKFGRSIWNFYSRDFVEGKTGMNPAYRWFSELGQDEARSPSLESRGSP
ncbi:hypothetical protein Tco_1043065 [Tanacetum coccineum]|uniref:Uncharacterized protein n=1 Tax=Tanacetum coccineum TaxID=301880 RepID=A0ABQ5GL03_9ASTR